MKTKSLEAYMRDNAAEIDKVIRREVGIPDFEISERERRLWVLNHEPLYAAAKAAGAIE